MKNKAITLSLVIIFIMSGCSQNPPESASSLLDPAANPESSRSDQKKNNKAHDPNTPEGAAAIFLDNIINIEKDELEEIISHYMGEKEAYEAYYNILSQISRRLSFKTGEVRENGNTAEVDVTVTALNAIKALNSAMPGALAHLAALQIAGKDISEPEKILADYAAKNIEWDKIQTVKTETIMYLKKSDNGEWEVDSGNDKNLHFANAVSGGAIDLAQSLKSFAERFK